MNDSFDVPVDVMALNVTIIIQSSLSRLPALELFRPDGQFNLDLYEYSNIIAITYSFFCK